MNFKIRQILWDIIDHAYPDISPEKRRQYHGFYFEIVPKECKSTSGMYHYKDRRIEVYNLSRDSKIIVKTCLHELAHHIDCCERHKSGHDENFYAIYKILLYTAMNMGIVTPDQMNAKDNSCDRNKVRKMVEEWIPKKIPYKENMTVLIVEGGYDHKDQLKQHGYHWNPLNHCWEIETEDPESEHQYLQTLGLSGIEREASDLVIEAMGTIICASANTYDYREVLKQAGFHFGSDKRWKMKVPMNQVYSVLNMLYQDKDLHELKFTLEKPAKQRKRK